MDVATLATAIGTAIAIIASTVIATKHALRGRDMRRPKSDRPAVPPPPPRGREHTGAHQLLVPAQDIADIREMVVALHTQSAEQARRNAQDAMRAATLARIAELLEHHHVSSERKHGDADRRARHLQRLLEEISELVRSRESTTPRRRE